MPTMVIALNQPTLKKLGRRLVRPCLGKHDRCAMRISPQIYTWHNDRNITPIPGHVQWQETWRKRENQLGGEKEILLGMSTSTCQAIHYSIGCVSSSTHRYSDGILLAYTEGPVHLVTLSCICKEFVCSLFGLKNSAENMGREGDSRGLRE